MSEPAAAPVAPAPTTTMLEIAGLDAFYGKARVLDDLSFTMGLTTGGAIGAETAKTLDDCVPLIQAMCDAAKEVDPEVIVLCHGGPIAEPDDAAYVLARTEGVVGFFGASSMERLPTETAMTENMRRFKAIPVGGAA